MALSRDKQTVVCCSKKYENLHVLASWFETFVLLSWLFVGPLKILSSCEQWTGITVEFSHCVLRKSGSSDFLESDTVHAPGLYYKL